jgi:phage baseplate assembly protein W
MAYRPININPLDLQPSTGIGVSIPFNNQSVFTTIYTTAEQLKYNIINYLLTDKKERLFNPGFGAGLRGQLFEQMTASSLASLEERIKTEIEAYFPKVLVTNLKITPEYDSNLFIFSLTYEIQNTGKSDQILLNFQNGQ